MVAKSKTVIPATILEVVERAIKARKRCAAGFSQAGIDNGHSTEGHLYLIEILKPKSDSTAPQIPKQSTKTKMSDRPGRSGKLSSNLFDIFEVEDTVDCRDYQGFAILIVVDRQGRPDEVE